LDRAWNTPGLPADLLTRITGDQGAASGVDRYGVTCVYAGTAEVRTVNQRVTGSVQLGDKCIAGSFEVSLKRACEREVRRRRPARYIDVSGTIDCKSESPIVSGTFQIGAIVSAPPFGRKPATKASTPPAFSFCAPLVAITNRDSLQT
jgi:hypothetical protein